MYPSIAYTRQAIIDIAKEDLEGYIDSLPIGFHIREYFHRAKDEIRQTTRVKKFDKVSRLPVFIEQHLDWLEMKYPDHKVPPNQNNFMHILEGWLGRLTQSKNVRLRKAKKALRAPHLVNFATHIVQRELGDEFALRILRKADGPFELKGFPSFLFIASGMKMVSIVFDEKQLEAGRNICAHEKRYEMCLLHEIGHFSLHKEYILQVQEVENLEQVFVRPAHEVDAWLYAGAIVAYLDSLRARITRLLLEEDKLGTLYY